LEELVLVQLQELVQLEQQQPGLLVQQEQQRREQPSGWLRSKEQRGHKPERRCSRSGPVHSSY